METLRAAAAEIDLAPPIGSWLTGFGGRTEPATSIHDPLMARALLLDDGDTCLAIVSCDLLGLDPDVVAAIRRAIAARSPIPAPHILIACTHTHSGPACMHLRGSMGQVNRDWLAEAQGKIANLVCTLPTRLAPARLAWASTQVPGIGYNRQDQTHPIDEELVTLAIDGADGSAIATVVNYATHAVVLGPRNLAYSGDHPGATARHLARQRGGIALYLQGACGDVDPVVYRDRGWGSGTFADSEEIGARLAEAAIAALAAAPQSDQVTLRAASRIVPVPLDAPPTPQALEALIAGWEVERLRAQAEGRVADAQVAASMIAWANALQQALAADALPQTLPAELFAARIADLRLVGLPFETYSDIGLGIKQGLAPHPTAFVGYANGLYGYCPTRWAKDQGGYGAADSFRWFGALLTPIGYGADELLIREGIALGRTI